jgi:hypothetical protein
MTSPGSREPRAPRAAESSGVARATALFRSQGLELPPVPRELARQFRERDKWCFSSRPVSSSPYDFPSYVHDGDAAADYVLVAHAGHGVNSWAIHYYLVLGPLRVFLQIGWGGGYEDRSAATARVNNCGSLARDLIAAADEASRRGRLQSGDRSIVVASDFYGGFCRFPGESCQGTTADSQSFALRPEELMTLAVQWCTASL